LPSGGSSVCGPPALKLATNPFIWEFVAGGIAGLIYHSAFRIESAVLCSALALAAVAFAFWNTFDPFVPGSLGVGQAFAMMISAVSVASKTIQIRAPRMLSYPGDISYTLYLEHLAIIYFLQSVYGLLGLKAQLSAMANIPVTVAACILAAALSSRFLEHSSAAAAAGRGGRRASQPWPGARTDADDAPAADRIALLTRPKIGFPKPWVADEQQTQPGRELPG